MRDKIINYLKDKKILILGFAREGFSTYKFIRGFDKNIRLGIADIKELDFEKYKELKEDKNIDYFIGEDYLNSINNYDIVMKTPGVVLKDYKIEENIKKITSQTDLFLRFTSNDVIGVTGTKGKSTTTSLIYYVLKQLGKNVVLAGNIGIPSFNVIGTLSKDTIVVYEMSCHQLENVKASPKVAILLNFYEEHLDHYTNYDAYINAKKNIYKFQNADDYLVCYDKLGIVDMKAKKIEVSFDEIDNYKIETKLRGRHNLFNIVVAIKTCNIFGVDSEDVLREVKTFNGLPHRLEYVGCYNGINFYNDSISTAVESTINGIESFEVVNTIIIGGLDRGIAYDKLVDYIDDSSIENIILLPDTNRRIEELFKGKKSIKNINAVSNMNEAVNMAKMVTVKSGVCLFSPAAASYNMYKNFEERGDDYKNIVANN